MKLETKLAGSTGALILAMIVGAVFAELSIRQTQLLSASITEQRLPLFRSTYDLRSAPRMGVRSLESYLLFSADPSASARFSQERRESLIQESEAVAKLKTLIQSYNLQREASALKDFESGNDRLNSLEDEAEQLGGRHTPEATLQANDLLHNQILPADAALFDSLKPLVSTEEALRDSEVLRLREASHSAIVTIWCAALSCSVLVAILSLLLGRHVTRAISLVADRANAIASGDLTGDSLDVGSSDQIGSLALAMQQMQNSLGNIIRTVAQTAGTLTASATSMNSATDHIHRRVDQQAQQTQQAATAMQEMSASIAEVSRHTQSAAETARSAAQIAHEGGAIVTQMLSAMHSIATAVNDTSSTIGLLGEDSRRISQIVTVIDEIATKTNLLALNAAIEAARAGDHGRGFAVVAGEVRRLAESTAQATGEISDMIQGIQERTRTAIASMASGTVTVEQGVVTTHRAGEALERIIGIAERVDRMIAQIAIAASQQAAAADQSSSSLDSIHTLSNDNLYEMATTTSGIESLRATAAALEFQVEQFRLDLPASQSSDNVARTSLAPRLLSPRKPLQHASDPLGADRY